MSEPMTINIRMIQHFMYCPRRYALLELNRDWLENAFVVKADLMHERVHDGSHSFSDSRKIVRSGIAVYQDEPEYDMFGVVDCVEFLRNAKGTKIAGQDGRFSVRIVEYKPKAPKGEPFRETDAIQVFAQKLCADYVWGCSSECYLYYADTRKRVHLPFDAEFAHYDILLKALLSDMRTVLQRSAIPPRRKGQKCVGCSVADLCFPKDKRYCVRDEIQKQREDMP